MTRDTVVDCYMISSKKVIAEMLYDTIEKYKNRTCDNCEYYSRIGSCINKESMMFNQISFDKFGCNEWEAR